MLKFNEINFNKYEKKGSDYHYNQINKKSLLRFNAYVYARYYLELEILKFILKKSSNNSIKVLDIGCGDGVFINLIKKHLKKRNLTCYGIDSSEIAIKTAKEKNIQANFKIANVYNVPFEDGFFDIILSSDVIEHLLNQKRFLSEISRVGTEKSTIIIGTPIRFLEIHLDKMHHHEFFPLEFKILLENFFRDIKIIQSHKLSLFLLYNNSLSIFKRDFFFHKTLINFASIYLNSNPFFRIKKNNNINESYSYMFGICKNNK